ncbi:hypothetical protein [Pedobacter rhizosphaerae]|uniref:Uncharacterized protein n=1 Tax=Pedobacter rhizosphaerae TaxID=390241 RepID=A0A1H9TE90_9SPHI|nr:hypothetical protein [Pedobacter rhizosphaerae]SER95149.1 hypothetical protein SAMN04488023_1224 [Pedobacter rhizosphaerae]
MIELDYFFPTPGGADRVIQLIQFELQEPWRLVEGDKLLGNIAKLRGEWRQVLGESLPAALVSGAGTFIDRQHYHALPAEIMARWPKLIEQVVMRSDSEFMVVCSAQVSFRTFEQIFSKYVVSLLQDEWPVTFRVYNHNFSEDFIFRAKGKKRKDYYGASLRW